MQVKEIHNKIAIALNSEAKSEVESVRWLLTRRAATALAIATLMVLGTLNYSRYMTTTQAEERKKHVSEMMKNEDVDKMVRKGSTDGLGEEALLAPEGISTA